MAIIVVLAGLVGPLVRVDPAAAATPPVVTVHPRSAYTTSSFEYVDLTADATGSPTPSVQWYASSNGIDWSKISGAISKTYRALVNTTTTGRSYRAVFTNSAGTATTDAATLTIATLPSVTVQPQPASVEAGESATFTTDAVSQTPVSIEWQFVPASGASSVVGTGTSYTRVASIADHGGGIRAKFTNLAGSTYSSTAVLSVRSAPVVATHPASVSRTPGPVTLTSTAYANPQPTAQWERSIDGGATWADAPGTATLTPGAGAKVTSSFTTNVGLADDAVQFRVRYANDRGAARSEPATVEVGAAPVITEPVTAVTVRGSEPSTFHVGWTDPGPVTVAWKLVYSDGSAFTIPSDGTGTLVTTLPLWTGLKVRAIVSNAYGSSTSTSGTITMRVPPQLGSQQPADATVLVGSAHGFVSSVTANPAPTMVWQSSTDGGTTWVDGATTTPTKTADMRYSSSRSVPTNQAGTTLYRARWSNSEGSATSPAAAITVIGPVITQQPTIQTVAEGETAMFQVAGTGYTGVTWQRLGPSNVWTDIAGATATTYSFVPTDADLLKQYRAKLTNADASTYSTIVTVRRTGVVPIATSASPASKVVDGENVAGGFICIELQLLDACPRGRTATFSSSSNMSADTVRWQRSEDEGGTWVDVAGPTDTSADGRGTYTTPTAVPAMDGSLYRAVFTNAAGSTASAPALLSVRYTPVITQDPASQQLEPGGTASFEVAFRGSGGSITWETAAPGSSTWTAIPNVSSKTLTVTDVALADDGRRYRATVRNILGNGDVTSAPATLTVEAPPSAPVADPVVQQGWVVDGALVRMAFSAVGSPAPDAVFEVSPDGENWFEVPDATVERDGDRTTVSVSIDAPLAANGWVARARFSNGSGATTSDLFLLKVGSAPVADPVVQPAAVSEGETVRLEFSAVGTPAPEVVFEVSPDGEHWFEVPDAAVERVGDRTTVFVDIEAPLDANGWQARARFTSSLGSVTTDAITLHVVP